MLKFQILSYILDGTNTIHSEEYMQLGDSPRFNNTVPFARTDEESDMKYYEALTRAYIVDDTEMLHKLIKQKQTKEAPAASKEIKSNSASMIDETGQSKLAREWIDCKELDKDRDRKKREKEKNNNKYKEWGGLK